MVPLKFAAALVTPFLSLMNVAPELVALLPVPLTSLPLPFMGYQPSKPVVGTYDGTCENATDEQSVASAMMR